MSAEDLTGDDGTSIDWEAVAASTIGAVALVWINGVISTIQLAAHAGRTVMRRVGGWIAAVIDAIVTLPQALLGSAWDAAAASLSGLGPLAFPLGVGIVVVTALVGWVALEVVVYD